MTLLEHTRDSFKANPRPAFAQPRLIAWVLLGGACGTGVREAILLVAPAETDVPWGMVVINVIGSFLLGFLLTALGSRTPESPARRDVRLFVGTGAVGGFTSYSALATHAAERLTSEPVVAVSYAVGTVVAGVATAFAGMLLAGAVFGAGGGEGPAA